MRASMIRTAAFVAGLTVASGIGLAQSSWGDGRPVFESDARKKADQAEAERAARRKAYGPVVYPRFMEGGERPDIKAAEPPIVHFDRAEEAGSIIVDTQARKLYFVLPGKKAYQYPISVGRDGFTWSGSERISRIATWPSWTPPPEMRKRLPGLPVTVTGGLRNPQGARALYLGSTIYRIHGTNNDRTVGRNNSSGCFRLSNEHVVHLASIARVGTKVRVLQAYNGSVSEGTPLSSLFSFGSQEPVAAPAKAAPRRPVAKRPAAKSAAAPAAKQVVVQPVAPAAIGSPAAPAAKGDIPAPPANQSAAPPAEKKAAE